METHRRRRARSSGRETEEEGCVWRPPEAVASTPLESRIESARVTRWGATERKKRKEESFFARPRFPPFSLPSNLPLQRENPPPSNYQIDRNISEKVIIRRPISNNYLKDFPFVKIKWRMRRDRRIECEEHRKKETEEGELPLQRENPS